MINERSDRPNKVELHLVAARQHGVITAAQLGLPRSTIADWARTGRLHRKYRGVYAYGHPHLSREGEWMAGVLAGGEGVALAGGCAAALLGVPKWVPKLVEIVVPRPRRQQPGLHVRICRDLDPRDITVVNGIPVTTVPRTAIDLAVDLDADDVAFFLHEAAFLNKFNLRAMRATLARSEGRRNLKVAEEALRLHLSGSAGTRSRLEKRFKRLVRGAGLPEPRLNTIVNGFEVDAYWPGVCVEVDGSNHRRPRTQADDRIRDAALRAAGYTVLRFTEDALLSAPATILDELREALQSGK